MAVRRHTAALTAIAMLASSLAGCSLIVQGTREDVKVRSNPPGAVARTGDRQVVTPGELRLKRDTDHTLVFERDGFPTRETTLESKPSWWMLGNVVFGGIIGLIVDLATGAGYKLRPSNVDMDMATGTVTEF